MTIRPMREISDEKFVKAIAAIDAANARDPNQISLSGQLLPSELVYSQRMTQTLSRLYPDASVALQLAARAQHIRRWEIPRESFPMDRAGYHRWRTGLYSFHADRAEEIMRDVGYDDATIARVRSLLKKEKLKSDAEMQALEDTICVVFLEYYFADFAAEHDDEKLVTILKRTWGKMSPLGHDAAMKLNLDARTISLVTRALSQP